MDMLFESEKQKEATERLLASVRVRRLKRVIMLEAQIQIMIQLKLTYIFNCFQTYGMLKLC